MHKSKLKTLAIWLSAFSMPIYATSLPAIGVSGRQEIEASGQTASTCLQGGCVHSDAEADLSPIPLKTPMPQLGQIRLSADHMQGEMESYLKATGHAVAVKDDQHLEADWLEYFQEKQRLRAGDAFTFWHGSDKVTGSELDYSMQESVGVGLNPTYAMGEGRKGGTAFHGDGTQVDFLGKNQYRVHQARISSCTPGSEDWFLNASTLSLDYERNIGVARHARLEFYGVPILYSPWMDFPLNNGRKSGFLAPALSGGSNGTEISTPYYWNMAPNYDATITPYLNERRGNRLGVEFRFLQPNYRGSIYTEQTPKDKLTQNERYLWNANLQQTLAPGMSWGYNLNQVSDADYFKDYGDRFSVATNVNLTREAWFNYALNWQGGSATTYFLAQRYQTLLDSPAPTDIPYARLPQVTVNANQQLPENFSIDLLTELSRFSHPTLQSGDRLVMYPSMKWRFERSWGFLKPKFGVHFTKYRLNNVGEQQGDSPSRTLPIFSLDSGLYLDRDTVFLGKNHLLSVEPRLFYVYIPTKNQNNLPNFDSSENDFSFAQMFSENTFSGSDRINGANQVTAAVTTRLLSPEDGLERMRVSVGKRYYFHENEITLAGVPDSVTESGSNTLVELGGDLTKNWRLDSSYEYNEKLSKTENYDARLAYRPAPGKVFHLRYRYGRNEQLDNSTLYGLARQVDVGAQWLIAKKWYAVARYNYSLADNIALDKMVGLQYNAGCWSIQFVGQRYVSDLNTQKNAFFVLLDFKGLGGVGNNPDNVLKLAIPGYHKINE